jgi:hypothetical protein
VSKTSRDIARCPFYAMILFRNWSLWGGVELYQFQKRNHTLCTPKTSIFHYSICKYCSISVDKIYNVTCNLFYTKSRFNVHCTVQYMHVVIASCHKCYRLPAIWTVFYSTFKKSLFSYWYLSSVENIDKQSTVKMVLYSVDSYNVKSSTLHNYTVFLLHLSHIYSTPSC